MASSDLILHSGASLLTAEQLAECRGPPAEYRWHPVGNATTTANENEVEEHQAKHQMPENREEYCCNRHSLEDRQLLELLEIQKRMFQNT
jgi:hypothetical protein